MSVVRTALLHSALGRHAALLVGIAATLILARLLTPEELGVFSVVAVIAMLGMELRDFGMVQYLVQERDLDAERLGSATTVGYLSAWSVALALWLGAEPLAAFYGDARAADIARIYVLSFLFLPLCTAAHGVLHREMAFARIATMGFVAALAGACTAVGAALAGLGAASLAWGFVAATATETALVFVLRPPGVSLRPGRGALRPVLRFGALSVVSGLVARLQEGLPDLIIGRLMSLHDVGIFSRGMGLVLLLNRLLTNAVRPVVLPALARARDAEGGAHGAYLQGCALITGIAWPFLAALFVLAEPTVTALFGSTWLPSVVVVEALCLWAALQSLFSFAGELLVANGKIAQALRRELISAVLVLGAVLAGAAGGLVAIALALAAAAFVDLLVLHSLFRRHLRVSMAMLFTQCWRSAPPALLAAAVALAVARAAPLDSAFLTCALGFPLALAAALLGAAGLGHPLWGQVRGLWQAARRRWR